MNKINIRQFALISFGALFALSMGQTVSANVLEEVVITAQKQEEYLQDVPVSVAAFSGDQISQLGYSDTTEITQQMPALQLNAWSPNLTIFNLRGISQNNFTDNLEGPIAVYFDDSYVASINGLSGQLFDMKRVEVLRGPQGTLFGRNATGGLIHYLSREAEEEEFNSYLQAEVGDFRDKSFEFALGGGTERARLRFAARAVESDGYIVSRVANPNLPSSGQDIGGEDGWAARLNLQVDFSDRLTASFWAKYSEDNDVPTGGYVFESCTFRAGLCDTDRHGRTITQSGVVDPFNEVPADVHEHFAETAGHLDRQTNVLQARFDYEVGDYGTFTSITNRFRLKKDYLEDGDALPLLVINFQTLSDYEQLTQEFRFTSEQDWVRWQVGLYYLDIKTDNRSLTIGAPSFNNIAQPDITNFADTRLSQAGGRDSMEGGMIVRTIDAMNDGPGPANGYHGAIGDQTIQLDSHNWSVFGQADFQVIPDVLEITAGLRWSRDDKNLDWLLTYTDNSNPTPVRIETSEGFAAQNNHADEIEYGDWAARLAIKWQVNANNNLFFSLNRGIKGGNWATGVGRNINAETFQHEEEVLFSFEAGVKSEPLDSLRINATIFSYDYSDYQVFSLSGGSAFVENTDADASGGEVEIIWTPTAGWDLLFGATFMNSSVDEVRGNPDPRSTQLGNRADPITDAELPNAPDFSMNVLARYAWLYDRGEFAVQLDGVYYGDQFLEVTNGPGTEQEAYGLLNARVSYTTQGIRGDDSITITGWVKNLTDEEYKVYSLDLGFLGVTTYYAPPVTSGVTFKYNYR